MRADGSDVALIDFEVVDAQGRRCPTDEARVDFDITGPAIWRGGFNAAKLNTTNNLYLDTECGINRVAIRSTLTPGTITLTAKRDGLQPGDAHVRLQAGCDQGRPGAGNAADPVASAADRALRVRLRACAVLIFMRQIRTSASSCVKDHFMNRQINLAVLLVATLVTAIPVLGQKYTLPASPRTTYNFNPGWKFIRQDVPGAVNPRFRRLRVDECQPAAHLERRGLLSRAHQPRRRRPDLSIEGIGWYRKHFKLPAGTEGQKVFLEFEGLKQAAHFYLNGQPVGIYENGITACGLDITALVKFGGQDNVLAVKVDNTIEYKEEATGTPFEWKFSNSNPNFGGLNRDVWLHVMGKVYQTLPLYENLQTTGVYVYGTNYDVKNKTATVNLEAQVRNETADAAALTLSAAVVDADGVVRAQFAGAAQNLAGGQTATLTATGPLAGAHFWDMNDPYLYDVYSILSVNGKVADVCKIHTGFRKAEYKGGAGTGGVWLNDHFVWLTGYSQRAVNDWPGLGQAYPDWMHDFNAALAARKQRQLHPLDAHFPAARGCHLLRQIWHCQCLSRRRRRTRCLRPPVGAAHGGHARLHHLFPQPPQHPFLGGGQLRSRRDPDGSRWWTCGRNGTPAAAGPWVAARSADPGAVAATEYFGVMLGGPYSDQARDHGPHDRDRGFPRRRPRAAFGMTFPRRPLASKKAATTVTI